MATAQRTLTLEEFLQLPEEKPALELIDGRITQKVSPQGQHSMLEMTIPEQINAFARPRRLALALPELRSTFAGASRVPDVCVFLWERIPRLPDGKISNVFTTPPDLAIEIVSPGQSVAGQVRRCQRFIADGVRLVLLVGPEDESVVRFGNDGTVRVLQNEERIDLDEVLPGLELTPDAIFAPLRLD
jgi:Uma2 family endonuclease